MLITFDQKLEASRLLVPGGTNTPTGLLQQPQTGKNRSMCCTDRNPITNNSNLASLMCGKHNPEEELIKSSIRGKVKLAIRETEESSPLKG